MDNKKSNETIILGIDPGTNILGYSLIISDKNTIKIINNGVVHLKKIENHYEKLGIIYKKISHLIEHYKPTILAIEAPFFGKNVQSMLKLGRAQGAAIAVAVNYNLEVIEYSPRKIKQSITGKGTASKEMVAQMLRSILQMEELPKFLDETDALAVAVCHHNSTRRVSTKSAGFKDWGAYLKENPNKISK